MDAGGGLLFARAVKGEALKPKVDAAWVTDKFIPEVAQRGAAIIKARGASSAASAASCTSTVSLLGSSRVV